MRWIKANVLAALVSGVASIAVFGLKQFTGVGAGQTGIVAASIFLVPTAVLYAASGAAWGVLTGAVLQRIIPRLPVGAWIALHAALAGLALTLSELVMLAPPIDNAAEPALSMNELLMFGLALGGTAGGVTGAIEALVLRKVAQGVGPWIGWSAVAFAVFVMLLVGIEGPRAGVQTFASELGNQVTAIVASLFMAIVMLPALRRLQPL